MRYVLILLTRRGNVQNSWVRENGTSGNKHRKLKTKPVTNGEDNAHLLGAGKFVTTIMMIDHALGLTVLACSICKKEGHVQLKCRNKSN